MESDKFIYIDNFLRNSWFGELLSGILDLFENLDRKKKYW